MAFPTIGSSAESSESSNVTSHVLTMPPDIAAGDLLVAFFANDGIGSATHTGWTALFTQGNGLSSRLSASQKVAEGGDTLTVTTAAAEQSAAWVVRIPAAEWHGTTMAEAGTAVVGSSDSPNPPTLTPSWGAEDTLWLAPVGCDANGTISSGPASFSAVGDGYSRGTGNAANSAWCGLYQRAVNVSPLDPGTYTISAAEDWVANTVAIRPAGGAAPVELGQAVETDSGLTVTLSKVVVLGQAVESNVGLPLTLPDVGGELGQAVETDIGLPLAVVKAASVGSAVETDSGLPVTASKTAVLGSAAEADVGLALSVSKVVTLGQAVETDVGLPVTRVKTVEVGPAVETDSGQVLAVAKALVLGQAVEVDVGLRLAFTGEPALERTWTIPAEDRVFTIRGEDRVMTVAADPQVSSVAGDDRVFTVPAENRTATWR